MTASTPLGQAVERAVRETFKSMPQRRISHTKPGTAHLLALREKGYIETNEFELIRLAITATGVPIQERRPLLDKLAGLALRMAAEAPSM